MNEVGSPTGDFHPISLRPCWAYQSHPLDRKKRHFFCDAKKPPLFTSSDVGVMLPQNSPSNIKCVKQKIVIFQ